MILLPEIPLLFSINPFQTRTINDLFKITEPTLIFWTMVKNLCKAAMKEKEVIATSQLRKQLQEEKNQLEKEKKAREDKEKENQEYLDFLEAFPDVKAEDIPKEVYAEARKSNLTTAYMKWQNAELKKQVDRLKQNEKNINSSVGSTTQFGSEDETGKTDLFLEGFNSV